MEHGDHKLLIEPCVMPKEKIFSPLPFRIKRPVNDRPFSLGLKVTNKGSRDFPGGTISDIRIFGKNDYFYDFWESLKLKTLKPEELQKLSVAKAKEMVLVYSGLYWMDCMVEASDGKKIITYQKTLEGDICIGEVEGEPRWCGLLLVDDLFQLHQRRINYWLAILTTIMVMFTIFLVLRG